MKRRHEKSKYEVWSELREQLEAAQSWDEVRRIERSFPNGPGAGAQYYSNLAYFLTYGWPQGATPEEREVYEALEKRLGPVRRGK